VRRPRAARSDLLHRWKRVLAGTLLLAAPAWISSAPPALAQADFAGPRMPYRAFDRLPLTALSVGGGQLDVGFAPGDFALPRERLLAWIEQSAHAISVYYGRFPVASARILVVPVPGAGVRHGQAFGVHGAAIRLMVGRGSDENDLRRDWKAVHEMVHLALPDLADRHTWLEEGLAVYVESIARVQAGDLAAETVWGEFARDMPKGLPGPGDRGLDHTPTWGRTYWGGAIFCLLADVAYREASDNRRGLQDALRAVLAEGGSLETEWPIARMLAVADEAMAMPVLAGLYERYGASPEAPDLDALWRRLGVVARDGVASFDDSAPLAAIRRAITAPPDAG